MPLTIKNLKTTVRLKSQKRESPLHEPAGPQRPSLEFAMPIPEIVSEGQPDPAKTATLGRGAASHRGPISARNADPGKVADRVYELMKREILLHRLRGGIS